jgi:hypothetical protein
MSPNSHLTGLQLLDVGGSASADARTHLAACPVCRARLDAARRRDAALAHALRALDERSPGRSRAEEDARLHTIIDRMLTSLRAAASAGASPPSAMTTARTGEGPRGFHPGPRSWVILGAPGLAR